MKVRVVLTVDVDRDRWCEEFGIPPEDVREDVTAYVKSTVREQLLRIQLLEESVT